jgi:exosortase/archaeosortase family protein
MLHINHLVFFQEVYTTIVHKLLLLLDTPAEYQGCGILLAVNIEGNFYKNPALHCKCFSECEIDCCRYVPKCEENCYLIVIGRDCTGWKSIFVFVALILASPLKNVRIVTKLKWIGVGIILLILINIFRIFSTIYIVYQGVNIFRLSPIKLFGVFHSFLWRESLMFIIFFMWAGLIDFFIKKEQKLNKFKTNRR